MDTTVAAYSSKLMFEDDEVDIIRFGFANESRKIRCSKSFLSRISSVFKIMFSGTWLKESTIELHDAVDFDQYSTFKLFLEIVYKVCDVNRLSVHQLVETYFYSHKYEVKNTTIEIQTQLNNRIRKAMSVAELYDTLQFAELYQLQDFKKKLDKVEVALDEDNPAQFFDLAVKFRLDTLKQQVIDHLKVNEPNDTWTLEMSNSVVRCLQIEKKKSLIIRTATAVKPDQNPNLNSSQLNRRLLLSMQGLRRSKTMPHDKS